MKKIDYDFGEAGWKFVILKFLEISAVLIFIYGFYYIGVYANGLPEESCNFKIGLHIPCPNIDFPTAFDLWLVGFCFCVLIILTLFVWLLIIGVAVAILYLIFALNWSWAKRWAETYESKKKRAIAKENDIRDEWKILEGDTVTIKDSLEVSKYYEDLKFVKRMAPFKGKTGRVLELDSDDHSYKLDIDRKSWWSVPMLKLKGKRENPFLKKLEEKK